MDPADIKSTTAYKIIRQMTDHIWGSDQDLSEEQIIAICKLFAHRKNNWQALMDGSMDMAVRLEECIESVIKYKKTYQIAVRVSNKLHQVQ